MPERWTRAQETYAASGCGLSARLVKLQQLPVGDELRRDERERSMNPDNQTRERKGRADFDLESTTPYTAAGFLVAKDRLQRIIILTA